MPPATSTPTLPDRYEFADTDPEIYQRWLDAGVFVARPERSSHVGGDREPFTVVMPPPNVTAILHVGHGLNNTIQDVIVRWARMRGAETLWVPGTDHAGIATQNVVEKLIATEGKTRFDLGRAEFVRRTEQFVAETGGVILQQLRAIGASADWTRTAYTLSPELSKAVRESFVQLYERGLIYRGHRVIHWCPRCLTSLSDEEAEFNDEQGKLYKVRYRLANDSKRDLVIATTRPETILADVAVAVNPEDDRYKSLVGQQVLLPLTGISVPVVADSYADPAFGTGVVKITPAHDANDFDVGQRHHLAMPVVIDEHGVVREVADAQGRVPKDLAGLERFAAREKIVKMLEAEGALVGIEQHQHAVRHCYRCDTVVEPRLSDQWFVKMKPLAEPALKAVREGAIRVLPERWEAVYINWLEGIRDWNISRQLWWGHRIPVWYCDDCDPPQNVIASREPLSKCPYCEGPVRQDEDVLDTWFSSWLWPISTLGWPNTESKDLAAFYPTDTLVTAPEILFFWVARMIMSGYAFMGRAPFNTVYLTGTVRDTNHQKMSKSLGNGIDPLDVVRLYGADALRWTLIAGSGLGADVILDPNDIDRSFATGRNFGTKLWNIGRFLLERIGDQEVKPLDQITPATLTRADHWILERLNVVIDDCDRALGPLYPSTPLSGPDKRAWRPDERFAGLRLNEYAEAARRFVWNELADWYVEAVKSRLTNRDANGDAARAVLVHTLDQSLRLLHPIVPFITESLWQRLSRQPDPGSHPERSEGSAVAAPLLAVAAWPRRRSAVNEQAAKDFDLVRDLVLAIRQIRGDNAVPPGKQIDVYIKAGNGSPSALAEVHQTIGRLSRANVSTQQAPSGPAAHAVIANGIEVIVPLGGLIDVSKECARLRTEVQELDKQITSRSQRLDNPKYVERAPAHVVASDRATLEEMKTKRSQLAEKIRSLCGD